MRSLRAQLFVTYILTLALAAVLTSAAVFAILNWNGGNLSPHNLAEQADRLERCFRSRAGQAPSVDAECEYAWIYAAAPNDLKYRLLNASNELVLSSDPGGSVLASLPNSRQKSGTPFKTTMAGIDMRVLTLSIEVNGSPMLLQVARSERLGMLRLPSAGFPLVRVAGSMLGSVLIFSVAVFYTLRRTLRPIREASLAASEIEPRNLSTRLTTKGMPTELVPLIDAFNLALDRLEGGYRVQRELLEAVAHELKTPLALIRGQIELEDRPDRATLLVDVDFMARQVHQLLHLAEVSTPQNYVFKSVDLALVAKDVVEYLTRLADRRSIKLDLLHGADQMTVADRSAVFVLLKNLVENAIQHSSPGGLVCVSVDTGTITVRDRGPGVAPEDFPNLFKRFWRASKGHAGGAGLGLAICHEIAQAHGWRLSARNRDPGVAFEIALTSPAPAP